MTTPFIVAVDIDAPLALWEEGLVARHREMFPDIITGDAGTRLTWNLLEGLSDADAAAVIQVMESENFYRGLRPVPGAREALYEMLDDGIELVLNSTPSLDNPTCASDKLWWIGEEYGRDIAKRTTLTQDKTIVFSHALVDDKPEITGLIQPFWKQVIYDRAYNQHAAGPRLFDWADWRSVIDPIRFDYLKAAA